MGCTCSIGHMYSCTEEFLFTKTDIYAGKWKVAPRVGCVAVNISPHPRHVGPGRGIRPAILGGK